MGSDLRYAFRTLRRSPGFAVIAILVLALGIGANTAMFSVIHAVLLDALPFEKPDQLVQLWMRFTGIGVPKDQNWVSGPEFMDVRQHAKAFAHLAAISGNDFNIRVADRPERVEGVAVSPSFFSVLGVQPIIGRAFRPEEETPGRDRVVVLSQTLWEQRFASDRSIAGRTININGQSHQIIGVMPKGFHYPDQSNMWTPLSFTADDLTPDNRGNHGLLLIGRLRDGLTFEAAQADMAQVSQRIIEGAPNYPYKRAGFRVIMNPMLEEAVGDIRPALLILMGSVAFVLLIACSNVANLLLARAAGREREIAVRTALGAGRGRLIRQLLTESITLSLIGAAFGMAIGKWGLVALARLAESALPRLAEARLNLTVLGFTIGMAVLTGILFGLWPALHASSAFTHASLKEGGRGGTAGGRQGLRNALVVAEVTLSLVLLAGAGLLIRSFLALQQVDPGFRPDHVLTMRISLPGARYENDAKIRNFYSDLMRRVSTLPGVETAGAISSLPLSGSGNSGTTTMDTQSVAIENRSPEADRRAVTPGLHQAMGIALVRGRYFDERDSETAAPVVIVDETLAKTYWPNEDAVGKRLKSGSAGSPSPWRTIVGVVRHVRFRTLESPSRVQIYWPEAQNPSSDLSLAIRTKNEPRALATAAEREVQAIDPDQPVYSVRTLDEMMADSMARRRLSMLLLSIFAGIAATLAAVGIYGVISYSVAQRTREVGIRIALGASRFQVMRMVMQTSSTLVLLGIGLGLAGSVFLTRLMSGMLFGIGARDPSTFAAVACGLLLVGLIAAWVPAHRATRVEPVEALRQE